MTQQAREKEKKRLVNLLKDFDKPNEDEWDEEELELYRDEEAVKELEILYGELAEHLLANGVIVPPCKAGDTVYVIANGKIREIVVDVISWTGFLFTFNDDRVYVDEREAYYTREAAEQALKERET